MTKFKFRKTVNYDPADGTIKQYGGGYGLPVLAGTTCGEVDMATTYGDITENTRVDLDNIIDQGADEPPFVTLIEVTPLAKH